MRRLSLLVVLMLMLVGAVAVNGVSRTSAQDEGTPTDGSFTEEGVSFEPLAFGETESVGLGLVRITLDPGAGFPSEADDPSLALVYMEAGTLTITLEGPITVTRAGAFDVFLASPEAEDAEPPTEEIPAGQEFQLMAGDSALFPANTAGDIRNDGTEPAVGLVAFYEPLQMDGEAEATPES